MSASWPEAIVGDLVGTVFRGQSRQRATLERVVDAAHDPPVVIARRTSLDRRHVRLYPRPLLVAQPDQSRAPPKSSLAASLVTRE